MNSILIPALLLRIVFPQEMEFRYVEPHMGTLCRIVLYASDQSSADKASKAAYGRIARLNSILSDYKPDSELNQLCRESGGEAKRVSSELYTVLSHAKQVSELSDGAFDITIGPVVRLWRQARKTQRMPDATRLREAMSRVGYRKMELDPAIQAVRLTVSGMQLDLGGIAKGYAADEALVVLREHGISRALVAMGGDIAVSNPPPKESTWRVGLAPLRDPNAPPSRYVRLVHQAISTSGDAEQHVEIDGVRYSHIVDPRSGIGLTGRRSVSVIARSGIQSDSLSKVASVLEPEKAMPILEKIPGVVVSVEWIMGDKTITRQSPGFARYVETGK